MLKGNDQGASQIELEEEPAAEHHGGTPATSSSALSRADEPSSSSGTRENPSPPKATSPRRTETSATEISSSLSSLDVTPEGASTDNDDSQRTFDEEDCGNDNDESLDPTRKNCDKDIENENDPFDESVLADLGFMMEGARVGDKQVLEWTVPVPITRRSIRRTVSNENGVDPFRVQVVAHAIDEEPGAVQSGHYLWPGARILVDYLVNHHSESSSTPIESLVELGAGCAVSTLACLQLHQSTIQVAVCTDHDPGVLERARDSCESTMEHLFSKARDEDELNDLINCLASIPVLFEPLEWGSVADAESISTLVKQHTVNESDLVDLVLGSDLIYSADVIQPLLTTASLLMNERSGRFVLSQSFSYDDQAEAAMVEACEHLGLDRIVLWQDGTGEQRVQEFRPRRRS